MFTPLLKKILNNQIKYKDNDLYVSVDINNYASMKCQCKCGFIPIKAFKDDKKEKMHIILKKEQVVFK